MTLAPAPLTIRFHSGFTLPISNVADAAKALADLRWPGKGGSVYKDAVRMTDEALCGYCKAQVALDAFRKAADDAGILDKSNAVKRWD